MRIAMGGIHIECSTYSPLRTTLDDFDILHISDFTTLGLHPNAFHIVVVKSGYLSPELAAIANPALMALSLGAVDQDIERLPREHLHTPTYPFQQHVTWAPMPVVSARSPQVGA